MQNIITWFQGKKTFIACSAAILYAVLGLATHNLDWNSAIQVILAALAGIGMRNAIANS